MFTEILASHILDPATQPEHRLTNCPTYDPDCSCRSDAIAPVGPFPETQPTQHWTRKSLGGKRITLNKVVNGKPHYIGPPGVAVDIGHRVLSHKRARPIWDGIRFPP